MKNFTPVNASQQLLQNQLCVTESWLWAPLPRQAFQHSKQLPSIASIGTGALFHQFLRDKNGAEEHQEATSAWGQAVPSDSIVTAMCSPSVHVSSGSGSDITAPSNLWKSPGTAKHRICNHYFKLLLSRRPNVFLKTLLMSMWSYFISQCVAEELKRDCGIMPFNGLMKMQQ